jgi:small subunit ribosomal protein S4
MRRLKKKYKRPRRPWDAARIKEEKTVSKEYGLRRKREIWKAQALLRNFRERARERISAEGAKKGTALLSKLQSLGLLPAGAGLDDVLALGVENILERRLQTQVFRKGLAKTPRQARQLIVHGKVRVGARKIIYPSYMVKVEEEDKIKKVEHDKGERKAAKAKDQGKAETGEGQDETPAVRAVRE